MSETSDRNAGLALSPPTAGRNYGHPQSVDEPQHPHQKKGKIHGLQLSTKTRETLQAQSVMQSTSSQTVQLQAEHHDVQLHGS